MFHAIQWINPADPNVAGWIKFIPSYFDGSEPFGAAWGIHIYWQQQVSGPTIDGTEARNDYVVVALDRRIGDINGWMGSRTYDRPGQSGGPFFGWWDGEEWPRAVAHQSWQNASTNGARADRTWST